MTVTDPDKAPDPLNSLRAAIAETHASQSRLLAGVFDNIAPKVDLGIDINRLAGTDGIAGAVNDVLKDHFSDLNARIIESLQPANYDWIYPKVNIDFGWKFESLLNNLDLTGLKKTFELLQPRNLRGAELDSEDIFRLMKDEGIPFCLVPDNGTARLLLDAPDRASRRQVLISRAPVIFAECEGVLALCVDPGLLESGALIRKAIGAFNDGHPEAAQTLATVVLDGLIGRYAHQGQVKNPSDGAAFLEEEGTTREWYFLLPIPAVHVKTWQVVDSGLFNRNTTVHKAALAQLTAGNAVQSIMLATSLLGFHQDLW